MHEQEQLDAANGMLDSSVKILQSLLNKNKELEEACDKWKQMYQIADKMAQKQLCILAMYDVTVPPEVIDELQGMEDAIKVLKREL